MLQEVVLTFYTTDEDREQSCFGITTCGNAVTNLRQSSLHWLAYFALHLRDVLQYVPRDICLW